jgi:hypothetical protein
MKSLRRRYGRAAKIPKVGGENPRTMATSQIKSELNRLEKAAHAINLQMIAVGRGREVWSETEKKNPADDDLTLAWQAVNFRRRDLQAAMVRRNVRRNVLRGLQ